MKTIIFFIFLPQRNQKHNLSFFQRQAKQMTCLIHKIDLRRLSTHNSNYFDKSALHWTRDNESIHYWFRNIHHKLNIVVIVCIKKLYISSC